MTSTSNAAAFLKDARVAVDAALADWFPTIRSELPGDVGEAIVYSLTTPGKRLRPALVLASYDALGGGGPGEAAELAAAVEVVHTYSLVHDDLPCMDDDALRRGRATVHVAFDGPTATEAGFRMVLLAARMAATGAARLSLADDVTGRIGQELFAGAGVGGMIGGQVFDLEAEGAPLTAAELERVHRAKTGALIAASGTIGALAAGAAPDAVDAVRAYGAEIGLAFQIVDDVLDATGTSDVLGKTAGKDAEQGKATFAALLGPDEAMAVARGRIESAVDRLGAAGIDSVLLREIGRFIVHRHS